jgi:outer membrane protein
MRSRSLTRLALVATAIPALLQAQQPTSAVTLTLGGAARLAAERTAGPAAARERVAQAVARIRQRRADFLPSLSAAALEHENNLNSASFPFSFADPQTGRPFFNPDGQVIGPIKLWDVRGTLRQSVFDPSAFARMTAARASLTASETEVTATGQMAAAAAAMAYVRATRAEAQVAAKGADSTLAAELLGIARDQVAAGVGIALDVTRAQAQLSMTRSQLIAARAERDRARLDLLRTLGLPADARVVLADSLASRATGEAPAEADAVGRAMRSRADLRMAADQADAAQRQLDVLRAERLPSLSLIADQGLNGKATNHLLSTFNWGIQLSAPVFDGFRRDGRLDEQRAAMRELDVRRRDLTDQATAEVRAALLDVRASAELLAASEERLALAEQELAQARDRFRAGVAGNAEVVTASIALNASRTQVIDARAALLGARVALARAQGTTTDLP